MDDLFPETDDNVEFVTRLPAPAWSSGAWVVRGWATCVRRRDTPGRLWTLHLDERDAHEALRIQGRSWAAAEPQPGGIEGRPWPAAVRSVSRPDTPHSDAVLLIRVRACDVP